jgi:hypothetical protein
MFTNCRLQAESLIERTLDTPERRIGTGKHPCVDLSVGVATDLEQCAVERLDTYDDGQRMELKLSRNRGPWFPHLHYGPIKEFHCPHADQRKG